MSLLREAQKCLRNQQVGKSLNAFVRHANGEAALQAVSEAARRHEAGKPTSTIDGRLIAVKDNICTKDLPTTCASGILQGFTSPFDATVVQKLRAAGAIVTGKTNLDEFGMGSHSRHSYHGAVKNLIGVVEEDALSAGGSSGGSALAVASSQCFAALGTDTGGSIRLPAAYTGIVGFKPSYGRLSRWGVVPYANSLDTVGILASDSRSALAMFNAIDGHDRFDPTSLSDGVRSKLSRRDKRKPASLRIGVPIEYNVDELSPIVKGAWLRTLQHLEEQGHTIQPVSLPSTKHALSAYYVLAPAEASSNLAKYDGIRYGARAGKVDIEDGVLFSSTRGRGFGDEVKRRILLGAYSLSAEAMDNYFIQAQRVRRKVQQNFDNIFAHSNPLLSPKTEAGGDKAQRDGRVDVIVCPTAPTLPPRIRDLEERAPVEAYTTDVLTVPASLAGLPAMSVPVSLKGSQEEAPSGVDSVGMQLISQFGDEDLLFRMAGIIEDWCPPKKRLDSSG